MFLHTVPFTNGTWVRVTLTLTVPFTIGTWFKIGYTFVRRLPAPRQDLPNIAFTWQQIIFSYLIRRMFFVTVLSGVRTVSYPERSWNETSMRGSWNEASMRGLGTRLA